MIHKSKGNRNYFIMAAIPVVNLEIFKGVFISKVKTLTFEGEAFLKLCIDLLALYNPLKPPP